jgi:hypothetical protein
MLDIQNRGDAFVGDPERDAIEFYEPLCYSCKHKIDVWACKAYPDGIPVKIITGEIDHTLPYIGDHQVVYEKL